MCEVLCRLLGNERCGSEVDAADHLVIFVGVIQEMVAETQMTGNLFISLIHNCQFHDCF